MRLRFSLFHDMLWSSFVLSNRRWCRTLSEGRNCSKSESDEVSKEGAEGTGENPVGGVVAHWSISMKRDSMKAWREATGLRLLSFSRLRYHGRQDAKKVPRRISAAFLSPARERLNLRAARMRVTAMKRRLTASRQWSLAGEYGMPCSDMQMADQHRRL